MIEPKIKIGVRDEMRKLLQRIYDEDMSKGQIIEEIRKIAKPPLKVRLEDDGWGGTCRVNYETGCLVLYDDDREYIVVEDLTGKSDHR